jgi:hypothetical protein
MGQSIHGLAVRIPRVLSASLKQGFESATPAMALEAKVASPRNPDELWSILQVKEQVARNTRHLG